MRIRTLILIVLKAALIAFAVAQSSVAKTTPDVAATGSVTGHVFLPESNLPARFANVALQPVDIKPQVGRGSGDDAKMPVTVVQTGMDGRYSIDRVAPGDYYVVVGLPGYLSPIAQFTEEQLKNPTPEIQQKITATVPTVDVRPNSAATADVRLTRGASLGGVVRFDDGSPDTVAKLALLKRNAAGRWEALQSTRALSIEDDGRFRVYGLSPGDYTLKLSMDIYEQKRSAALGWVNYSSSSEKSSLQIYSGDTFLENEAKVLTLTDGQILDGQDITIPASKLHAVSGAVIDARTGQALNEGHVALMNADGKSVASASIDMDARTFTFGLAPEGEYTLKISDAREVQIDPVAGNSFPSQHSKETMLHGYDGGAVPVLINGEMTGVTIPVSEKRMPVKSAMAGTL